MDYMAIYTRIIERARDRNLTNVYSERHHIVPKCMKGNNDASNIVRLTPEEHYVAHQLLVKIYPGHIGIAMALKAMTMNKGHRNNKAYGWVKRLSAVASSQRMKNNNPNKDGQQSIRMHQRYRDKHGRNRPGPEMTAAGLQRIREGKLGAKNPNFAVRPWRNCNASEYSITIWSCAVDLHSLWLENDKPSYARLYRLHSGKSYTTKTEGRGIISPYMSIIKYFRNGWTPLTDSEWVLAFITTEEKNDRF
jgi:hypothetical protein